MKKRLIFRSSLLLMILVICSSLFVTTASATSGNLNATKPTKQQIVNEFKKTTYYINDVYEESPSVSSPYRAGVLTDAFLESGLTYLNYIRYVANLPAVQLDNEMNETAQHGAVVMAANQVLSHYPDQPSDMDDSFYERGYSATTTSNIGYGYTSLPQFIQGCVDDSDISNLSSLGHRRWFLNPTLLNVGFGFAAGNNDRNYSVAKVFDTSGESINYNYVSWPASGYFPNNLFNAYVPWSITLNPSKYLIPSIEDITITLTRQSDGKTLIFNEATGEYTSHEAPYIYIDTNGYGCARNAIIFYPGTNNMDSYNGKFTVSVSGIYTKSGTATTINYEVDFFDIYDYISTVSITKQPTDAKTTSGKVVKTSISATGDGLTYQWYISDPDSYYFVESSVKSSTYSCRMNDTKDGRMVYCIVTDRYGNTEYCDIAILSMADPVSITKQPQTTFGQLGETVKTTVEATGDGLTYQWYIRNADSDTYVKSSITGPTYSCRMSEARNGRRVICYVTDKYGNKVKSKTVVLRMTATITKQPTTAYAQLDKVVKTSVTAVGDGLTYQWYIKNPGSDKYVKSSVTGPTYSCRMSETNNGRRAICYVIDKYGNKVQSKTVVLRMSATITEQPKTTYAKAGQTIKVPITAVGDGLTYQWYVKNPGSDTYTRSSITSPTYSCTMDDARDGRRVLCYVTDKYGNKVKSTSALILMK